MFTVILSHLWIVWIVLAVLFVVVEACTTSLVSIWFVPGAVVSAVLSLFVDNLVVQIVVFLAVSVAVFILCRRVFKRGRAERLGEANELLIGKIAVTKAPVSDVEGKVLVGDVYWRAVSESPIDEGERVRVCAVSGNTLTVEKS